MSSEITDAVQVVRLLFEGSELIIKLTGIGIKPIKGLAAIFAGVMTKEKLLGKTSMKKLLQHGGDLHVFQFPSDELKRVAALAKKYGILYSMLPDLGNNGLSELIFHAESLPRMNALLEKLKIGQIINLENYIKDKDENEIIKFYEANKPQNPETEQSVDKQPHKDTEKEIVITGKADRNQGSQPLKESTGYLKREVLENIPLSERVNIMNHYRSGEYDPITITRKLVLKETPEYMIVRLPRESNKFIKIASADFWSPPEGKTILAFLKKDEAMKIYDKNGHSRYLMSGDRVYADYFDEVREAVRTAVETEKQGVIEKAGQKKDQPEKTEKPPKADPDTKTVKKEIPIVPKKAR